MASKYANLPDIVSIHPLELASNMLLTKSLEDTARDVYETEDIDPAQPREVTALVMPMLYRL